MIDFTIPTPSLLYRCGVNIAVSLWKRNYIEKLKHIVFTVGIYHSSWKGRWQKIVDEVLIDVGKLPIPEGLQKELSAYIRRLGWQMAIWYQFYTRGGTYHPHFWFEFCWTSHGTIDKRRTIEILLKNERIPNVEKYWLSRIFCVEEYFTAVDNGQSCNEAEKLIAAMNGREPNINLDLNGLANDWYCRHPEVVDRVMSPAGHGFRVAVSTGNVEATKYFFKQLSDEEKDKDLVKAAMKVNGAHDTCRFFPAPFYAEVFCFLLSVMNEEQQMEVLKTHLVDTLQFLLHLSCPIIFIRIVQFFKGKFSKNKYCSIMTLILQSISESYGDNNYIHLLKECWLIVPHEYQEYVIRCIISMLFQVDFDKNNRDFINIFWDGANAHQKQQLTFWLNKHA